MIKNLLLAFRPSFTSLVLLIFFYCTSAAQSPVVITAPQSNTLAAGFFIPNSTAGMAYARAAFFIHRQEMAPHANVSMTSFSIPLIGNTNTLSTVGNFTLYFENTSANRQWFPWSFANVIAPMTMVYAGTLSIPAAGVNFITVNLQTPFVYTGGGFNVAYAWDYAGPYSNVQVNAACTDLFTGIENYGTQFWTSFANSSTAAPTTIGGSTFWRPCFRFGGTKLYTNDLYVADGHTPGKVLSNGNGQNTVVYLANAGTSSAQNVSVSLVSSGANSYSTIQVLPNLPASATQSMAFSGFSPSLSGINTLTVRILNPDADLQNNAITLSQSVTCNEVSGGFRNSIYPYAYYSNGQPAIIAFPFTSLVTRTLTAIRLKVSNYPNSSAVVAGVLCNAAGSVMATTGTVNTSAAALLTMTFSTPLILNPNVKYYYGVDVQTPGTYPISADITLPYTPEQAFEIPAGGGTPLALQDDMSMVFGVSALFNFSAPVITSNGNKYSCSGSSVTISANSAGSFSWSTGATSNSIVVSPVNTSTYYVWSFNSQCNANASVAVFVSPIPSPSITGASTLCEGATGNYNAAGAWSYTWSTGMTGPQSPYTSGSSAFQVITVQGANVPCPAVTASFQIQLRRAPSLQIVSPYASLCNTAVGGKTLQLSGQPLGGVFSGSLVSPTGIVTPTSNGVITAFYSFTNAVSGCTATTSLELPVSSCLGLGERPLATSINIFPNPSSDGWYRIEPATLSDIKLMSMDGKVLPTLHFEDGLLDGKALKPGIYILEVHSEQGFSRVKLIRD